MRARQDWFSWIKSFSANARRVDAEDTASRMNRILDLLLNKGADINVVGGDYGTALAAAAYCGWPGCVSYLLERSRYQCGGWKIWDCISCGYI